MTWSIQPVCHFGWIAAAGAALLAALAWGSRILLDKNISRSWIVRLAVLRILVVLLVILSLLRPSLHYEREVDVRPDRLILLDTSASMGLADAVDGGTRLENVLRGINAPLARRALLDPYENHWYAFDTHARPLDSSQLDAVRPDGRDTRIGAALEEALNLYHWSEDRANVKAPPPRILLISDGVDRGRLDPLGVATRLGLTVDAVAPETIVPEADPKIEISDVQYSRRVLLGSELRVHAAVRQTGFDGASVRLILECGGQPVRSRTLRFGEQEAEQRVTISHRPDRAGFLRCKLLFETDDAELQPFLNSSSEREITVRVESHNHEVLVIEPEWRWEFRFLRRVLESDPGFAFSGFLSRGPGVYIQFGESHRRVSLAGFPQFKADLDGFDTFILGDANPGRLPPHLPDALYDLVVRDGKSMVVIAGPNIAAWSRHPALAALLPVELYPASGGLMEGPVPVRISVEGRASPFFFAPEDASSLRRWPQLPPVSQIYAPLRKKPAATVLLEAANHNNEFGPLIAAAVHTVGRGQVLFIATDTLWKWQMRGATDPDGNTPYHVFWQQAMRAIRPERLGASPFNLWLIPDRTHATVGQPAKIHARIEGESDPDIRVVGETRLPDDRVLPLLFTRDAEEPGRFLCRFEAAKPGFYEIRADAVAGGRVLGEAVTAVDFAARPDETAALPPNIGFLEHLTSGSGGDRINLSSVGSVESAKAVLPEATEVRQVSVALWPNLWLIAALTLVLGADWIIRLMRGYV